MPLTGCGGGGGRGGVGAGAANQPQSASSKPVVAASSAARPGGVQDFHSVHTLPRRAAPARIRIPAIGVNAPVVPLGRLPDGSLSVPRRWGDVGWYAAGPYPGEPGPAALLGHVDSRSGPAVFYRLRSLRPGSRIDVVGTDSRVLRFRVSSTARYPKNHFPTEAVYLPTLEPLLQLITCAGDFDHRTGHYVDNYVVTAGRVG